MKKIPKLTTIIKILSPLVCIGLVVFFKDSIILYSTKAMDAFIKSPFYNSDFIQSNAFNFVCMIIILAIICKKAKLNDKLTSAQEKIKETIDKSIQNKESSIQELLNANERVKNVKDEILEIKQNSEKNIKLLKEKIEKETILQIENIENNTKKNIEAQNNNLTRDLIKNTALASYELAKKHIIEILQNKPQYHQKFIDESIEELEAGLK